LRSTALKEVPLIKSSIFVFLFFSILSVSNKGAAAQSLPDGILECVSEEGPDTILKKFSVSARAMAGITDIGEGNGKYFFEYEWDQIYDWTIIRYTVGMRSAGTRLLGPPAHSETLDHGYFRVLNDGGAAYIDPKLRYSYSISLGDNSSTFIIIKCMPTDRKNTAPSAIWSLLLGDKKQ
jgi:hypothetical protein